MSEPMTVDEACDKLETLVRWLNLDDSRKGNTGDEVQRDLVRIVRLIRDLLADNAAFRAIVERLPVTADGVRVAPESSLYRVHGNPGHTSGEQCGVHVHAVTSDSVVSAWMKRHEPFTLSPKDYFSTREAAERAAKEQD